MKKVLLLALVVLAGLAVVPSAQARWIDNSFYSPKSQVQCLNLPATPTRYHTIACERFSDGRVFQLANKTGRPTLSWDNGVNSPFGGSGHILYAGQDYIAGHLFCDWIRGWGMSCFTEGVMTGNGHGFDLGPGVNDRY